MSVSWAIVAADQMGRWRWKWLCELDIPWYWLLWPVLFERKRMNASYFPLHWYPLAIVCLLSTWWLWVYKSEWLMMSDGWTLTTRIPFRWIITRHHRSTVITCWCYSTYEYSLHSSRLQEYSIHHASKSRRSKPVSYIIQLTQVAEKDWCP
jgi:hypothetical protein